MTLKNPILSNPIAVDIPKLNEILDALSKANPTDVDGISTGAVRLYEASSGKWQWQVYNGSTWVSVPFLQHNVDQLDGYHATVTPAANTVAVRGTDGKLKDDITGNAATATTATTLSQTLPVNKGGTGATSSEAVRANLGVPPTSHASTNTTHGVGNATQYGHLKLNDATDSLSGATGGIAATPAAVKVAKDAADDAMEKASTLATAAKPGIAYFPAPFTIGADGKAGIRAATIGQTGIVQLNDTVTSTSTTQAATANAAKMAYDKAVEAASKAGLPLGYIYAWPYKTPMDGSIQINGQLLNRQLYADLFAYAQAHDQVISESEWQSKAAQQGGYCTYYSDGDGSTTFRAPKFAPYIKLALFAADAGKYYEAGLPNITGTFGMCINAGTTTGAFSRYTDTTSSFAGSNGSNTSSRTFDASSSNLIYGNSTTVQPESIDWIVCVVAFGAATNVGSVDVANVMAAVGQVQAEVATKLGSDTAHIVESNESEDGTVAYRKWSDGYIEVRMKLLQNKDNTTVNFPIEFTKVPYCWGSVVAPSTQRPGMCSFGLVTTTTFVPRIRAHDNGTNVEGANIYACGY